MNTTDYLYTFQIWAFFKKGSFKEPFQQNFGSNWPNSFREDF